VGAELARARAGADERASAHVARQPIYEAGGALFGYELLFRTAAGATTAAGVETDDDGATTATILAAFSEFGADELLGGRPGFINLTRAFIVGALPLPFPPEAAVLEILENVRLDPEVVAGAVDLREAGYRLAMDDFVWTPEAEPLLALADIAKIDVLAMTWDEVLTTVEHCRRHGVRLLAEKVEDAEMAERCRAEGFELFQGYHLGRPETMTVETLSPGQTLALQLVGMLGNPDVTTEEIEGAVRRDPALVYRLLKIANSAASGVTRQVGTIRDALVMVGVSRLRAWLVLLSLSSEGAGGEAIVDALARARTCERVSRATGLSQPDVAFTAGLLDGVAESLGLPSEAMLERMPALASDLVAALRGQPGELREVLEAVVRYEKHLDAAASPRVPLDILSEAYLGALAWTTETTRATGT
jgi:EAL and modified HD-GYP domain-containing signal transduction protein